MNAPFPSEPTAVGMLPIGAILPSPSNPRKRIDAAYIAELAESIKHHGLIQPITVRPLTLDGLFEFNRRAHHDAGAYARCSHCGRYSDNHKALAKDGWPCDCGLPGNWSGSFRPPTAESKWSDATPNVELRGGPGGFIAGTSRLSAGLAGRSEKKCTTKRR